MKYHFKFKVLINEWTTFVVRKMNQLRFGCFSYLIDFAVFALWNLVLTWISQILFSLSIFGNFLREVIMINQVLLFDDLRGFLHENSKFTFFWIFFDTYYKSFKILALF